MYIGANMSIGFPFKIYITALSDDGGVGDFRLKYRYEKYDPNKQEEEDNSGGTNVIVIKNDTFTTQYVEQGLWESEEF